MTKRDDEREKFDLRERSRLNWDSTNADLPKRFGPKVALVALMAMAVFAAVVLLT